MRVWWLWFVGLKSNRHTLRGAKTITNSLASFGSRLRWPPSVVKIECN